MVAAEMITNKAIFLDLTVYFRMRRRNKQPDRTSYEPRTKLSQEHFTSTQSFIFHQKLFLLVSSTLLKDQPTKPDVNLLFLAFLFYQRMRYYYSKVQVYFDSKDELKICCIKLWDIVMHVQNHFPPA